VFLVPADSISERDPGSLWQLDGSGCCSGGGKEEVTSKLLYRCLSVVDRCSPANFQTEIHNIHQRYRREFELMLSSVHNRGMQDIRAHLGTRPSQSRPEAKSWLAQQRKLVGDPQVVHHISC
jgi:hypothetical protein